ncbi:MAG: hypothetical protein HYY77_23530 [Betaproteobacteria bacterium]|nr:hypothetical protein [Betaproteobacteria bacterium]
MAMYHIGIVFLGLVLLPHSAVASNDDAVTEESSVSTPATPPSAPAEAGLPLPSPAKSIKRAVFLRVTPSRDVRHIADWVVDSGDNKGLPFVIIDKKDARVFIFDSEGRIRGAAPALLGVARGDDTVPGIGERELSDMPPETRTTPAGRFVAALGMSTRGVDVLWVDYEAAISLHRVIINKPEERRFQRLATPTPRDNRISYGCINVPKQFYETVVRPAFSGTNGIVYVLPEMRPARAFFSSYDIAERALQLSRDRVRQQHRTVAEAMTTKQ